MLRVFLRRLRAGVASFGRPPSPQLSNPSCPLILKAYGQCPALCWARPFVSASHGPPASWAWLRRPHAVCESVRRAFRPSARLAATRAQLFGPRLLPHSPLAMPRKKKAAATPTGPQDAGWVEATAASFDARYQQSPAGLPPSAEVTERAFAAVAPPVTGGSSGSAGVPEAPLSQARLASVLLHRRTGEGLTATGFEPERHSMVVLGRPVQARPHGGRAAIETLGSCFLRFVATPRDRSLSHFHFISCCDRRLSVLHSLPVPSVAAHRAFRRVSRCRAVPLHLPSLSL